MIDYIVITNGRETFRSNMVTAKSEAASHFAHAVIQAERTGGTVQIMKEYPDGALESVIKVSY